jgi:hypothetical protein
MVPTPPPLLAADLRKRHQGHLGITMLHKRIHIWSAYALVIIHILLTISPDDMAALSKQFLVTR